MESQEMLTPLILRGRIDSELVDGSVVCSRLLGLDCGVTIGEHFQLEPFGSLEAASILPQSEENRTVLGSDIMGHVSTQLPLILINVKSIRDTNITVRHLVLQDNLSTPLSRLEELNFCTSDLLRERRNGKLGIIAWILHSQGQRVCRINVVG